MTLLYRVLRNCTSLCSSGIFKTRHLVKRFRNKTYMLVVGVVPLSLATGVDTEETMSRMKVSDIKLLF